MSEELIDPSGEYLIRIDKKLDFLISPPIEKCKCGEQLKVEMNVRTLVKYANCSKCGLHWDYKDGN